LRLGAVPRTSWYLAKCAYTTPVIREVGDGGVILFASASPRFEESYRNL
jgi:hypothetical protein